MSQGIRRDSYRNPDGIRKDSERTPGPPESGYGKGYGKRREGGGGGRETAGQSEELARRRYHAALDWAKRALPGEHGPFGASAAMTITALGGKVSAEAVRRRLVEQGRDAASLERLG